MFNIAAFTGFLPVFVYLGFVKLPAELGYGILHDVYLVLSLTCFGQRKSRFSRQIDDLFDITLLEGFTQG